MLLVRTGGIMQVRLKAKLVVAISWLAVAVVTTFSAFYISYAVRHTLEDAYADANFVGRQVFQITRDALQANLKDSGLDANDPQALRSLAERTWPNDPGLKSLLQSVIFYSPTIWDVSIVDSNGRAMVDTYADQIGKLVPEREQLGSVVKGSITRQIGVVFGPPSVYELSVPLVTRQLADGADVGLPATHLRSWNQIWTGTDQTRNFKFENGRLILTTNPQPGAIDPRMGVAVAKWEKLE